MHLWRLIINQYRYQLIWLTFISIASAIAGVSLIAYINNSLSQFSDEPWRMLYQLIGLLILLFTLSWVAQFSLSYIGHKFVFEFRNGLVKRVLDTDIATIERIGSSRILATLSKDINTVQSAFMSLPAFVQASILCITAAAYLGYLAWDLFFVVIMMIGMTGGVGSLLVKHVYKQYKIVRDAEDDIYQDFESIINGRKELSLNRLRAKRLYHQEFKQHALKIRKHIVYGDTLHFTALNWADTMVLGTIGVVFFLAVILGWADSATATTFAVTILFLKSPLIQLLGIIPNFLNAHVSFNKINELQLAAKRSGFDVLTKTKPWQTLQLQNIRYHYTDDDGKPSFGIGPINLTVHKGEVIFLIGGNGSGKSTLAKILTGLYRPHSGQIRFDDYKIDLSSYRQYFSAVYSDLHLFKTVLSPHGSDRDSHSLNESEQALMSEWLTLLQMQDKLDIDNQGKVLNQELSQGQRKRLALLLTVMEQRDFILLDEWAADQDPQFRRVFYHELIPKLKVMGKTLFIISHDDHYFEQADRLLQMHNGQLIELTGQDRVNASRDAIAQIN